MLPLAAEIPTEWIAAIGSFLAATIAAAAKVIWGHFQKREEERDKYFASEVEDRDNIIKAKDLQLDFLTKEITRKSEEHSRKVESLMNITLEKVEVWVEKHADLLDRVNKSQSGVTSEIRGLTVALTQLHDSISKSNDSSTYKRNVLP